MANRFTDTEKWKDPWFRKLSGEYKLLYLFILDTCDCAGIWQDQLDDFNFQTGFNISMNQLEEKFSAKVIRISDDAFIVPRFVLFQNKGEFNPDRNKAHLGIKRRLDHYGIKISQLHQAIEYKDNDAFALKGLQRGFKGASKPQARGTGIGIGKGIGIGIGIGTGTGIEIGIGKGTGTGEGIGIGNEVTFDDLVEFKESLLKTKQQGNIK